MSKYCPKCETFDPPQFVERGSSGLRLLVCPRCGYSVGWQYADEKTLVQGFYNDCDAITLVEAVAHLAKRKRQSAEQARANMIRNDDNIAKETWSTLSIEYDETAAHLEALVILHGGKRK